MVRLFKEANVFLNGNFTVQDFFIDKSKCFQIYNNQEIDFDEEIDCKGLYAFPGFIDPHVHLREPGFTNKDTIKTGTLSAAKGGYTTVFAMPNLNPVPDCQENLQIEKEIIKRDAIINVIPVCSITKEQKGKGQLSDIANLSSENKLFSDDGKGVQDKDLMKLAMQKAKLNNAYILAHCEDESYLNGGSLNLGRINKKYDDAGISNQSEYVQLQRDVELAKSTHCKYHACHISTKESVDILCHVKDKNITGEATIHHLLLNENDIDSDNGIWKMNPPLRSVDDQYALIDAIIDGTINMICTDNAPHSFEEKNCSIKDSAFGIVSIEVAFPLFYTNFVRSNKVDLIKAIKLFSCNIADFFELDCGYIKEGKTANICLYNLDEKWKIDSSKFASIGKSCPFDNWEVFGKCKMTICNGDIVYREIN